MKKITYFIALLLLLSLKGKAQLLTQNFDSELSWTVGHPVGTATDAGWSQVSVGEYPNISPYSGAGMAKFNAYGINAENSYDLTSPSIAFAGGAYRVSFKMYRDDAFSERLDKIDVYYSTGPTSTGGILLGTVNRPIESSPEVAASGWYNYNFNIPGTPTGPGYISFLATSVYGNNIYLDNVVVEAQPTCLAPTALLSSATINSATVSFTSSTSGPALGYQYELRTSGAAGSGATGLVASATNNLVSYYFSGLVPNTNYFFYVKSLCSAIDSSAWENKTFKTLPVPPANDNCFDAVTLPVNANLLCANVTSGTLLGATASGESTPTSVGVPDDDVWYKFTATSALHRIVLSEIEGSATDLVVEILAGDCGGGLYNVAISDPESFLLTDLSIGDLYYLRVFSYNVASNPTTTFKICVGTPPPPPANDNCSGAVLLTPSANMTCVTSVSGTTASATESLPGCSGEADDDVWYKFVATSVIHGVLITNVAGATDIMIEAFDACGGTSLKCQDSPDDLMTLSELTIGSTYYFRIYSYYSNSETSFTVCVGTPPPPPSNDSPSTATILPLSSTSFCENSIAGTTISASNSSDNDCSSSQVDVWYVFTPATSGTYYFSRSLTGSNSNGGNISLYSGTPGNLTPITDNCYLESFGQALVAGTAYYVSISSYETEPVNFTLCAFLAPAAPANDLIANATVVTVSPDGLTCANAVTGSTLSATHSADNQCDSSSVDVWYTFTPATTASYYVNRSVISGAGDGYISIYSGTSPNLTKLNDNCYSSTFSQNLTAGVTYYISVSSGDSEYLSFSLCVFMAPPPPANDECENAITLTAGGQFSDHSIVATNTSATRNPNSHDPDSVPSTCDTSGFSTNGKDVWFKVTVPPSGKLTIETATNGDSSMTDTALYIYRGNSCNALTYDSCSADIGSGNNFSRVSLTGLTSGETLTARVWGYNGSQGTFKIGAFDATLNTVDFDANSFKAYPNPVKDVLNLSYSENIATVSIYNILGQQVITKSINDVQAKIDMSALSKGAYLVKLNMEGKVKVVKIIKE